jgi:hypothetical protein
VLITVAKDMAVGVGLLEKGRRPFFTVPFLCAAEERLRPSSLSALAYTDPFRRCFLAKLLAKNL